MLKIGEYFRTPWGDIGKITNIPKHNKYFDDGFCLEGKFITCGIEAMKELNSTPNIIELLQVGDYVNGQLVKHIAYFEGIEEPIKKLIFADEYHLIPTEVCEQNDIKSIVTKEKYESIEYRIGE